jgi:general secretion pathway protein A
METGESKLLQIVLVGQLNLLDVLAEADMRQLDQRIALRAMLKPLTREEVEAYIAHRVSVARGSSSVSFGGPAIDTVYAISGGVPRVINLLCDRALMLGAQEGAAVITPDLIREAASALTLKVPAVATIWWRRMPWWLIVLVVVLLLLAAVLLFAPFDPTALPF